MEQQFLSNNSCQYKVEDKLVISNILLKDVIDINVLQCLQDDFAKGLGLASITVDLNGNPVTKPSNYTRFCMDYTHSTKCGDKRCATSHRIGGEEAARLGKPVVYECHAGLIDFAVPIVLEGRQIGTILGGQVLTDAPDEFKYRKIAGELGVDEDGCVEAVKEICQLSRERVEAAANVLYIVANYMSKTAYFQQLLKARSNLLSNSLNKISVSMQALAGAASVSNLKNTINMTCSANPMIGQFIDVIDLTQNIEHVIAMQQKEMARLERLNLIGEMAASIGHEVRNPITTVRGFLQYFSRKAEFSSYITNFSIMIEELDRANEIITEFLALAKNRKVDLKKQDVNQVITKFIPLLQADATLRDIQIKLNLNSIPLLLIDEKEIRQLVLNLVRNAIDATEENGVIEIATLMYHQNPVLEITDKGCGIANDILDKIGTPFFSTKSQGTGLGLAVCYRIAHSHSASMVIDSKEGIGTRVQVIFNQQL